MDNKATEVYPDLYVSNIDHVREGDTDKYDRVVTVCQDRVDDNLRSNIDYHHFNLADGVEGTFGGKVEYSLFEGAAEAVYEGLMLGDTVLVHCHAGISRSVSVASAVVGVATGHTFDAALFAVTEERERGHPHDKLQEFGREFVQTHSKELES